MWRPFAAKFAPPLRPSLAFGLARNHPFVDGNKRIAFASLMVFLRLNGAPFRPPPAKATVVILELAARALDEAGLATWIRAVLERSAPPG